METNSSGLSWQREKEQKTMLQLWKQAASRTLTFSWRWLWRLPIIKVNVSVDVEIKPSWVSKRDWTGFC